MMHWTSSQDKRSMEIDVSDLDLLKFSLIYVRKHLYQVILTVTVVILSTGISLLPELYLKRIFDVDLKTGDISALWKDGATMVILYFAAWLLSFSNAYLVASVGQGATFDMRMDMYRKLMNQSMDYFEKNKSGQINSRITNDVETLSNFLGSSFSDIISAFLQLLGIMAIMVYLDVKLGLISLSIVPIMILIAIAIRKPIRKVSQSRRKSVADVTSSIAESISGAKVSKAFAKEKETVKEFNQVNKKNLEVQMKATSLFALIQPLFSLVASFSTVILMVYTGQNPQDYSVGTVVTFNAYLGRFFFPIIILTTFYSSYQSALASLERIYSFLNHPISVTEKDNATELNIDKGDVIFDHVSFGYTTDNLIFNNLSVFLGGKKTTAIVGPTGAGKSTFIKLLSRFYDPINGRILIDGQNIKEVSFKSLRERIGVIPQTPYLFSGSIFENITYGTDNIDEERVEEIVRILGLNRMIENLPEGIHTELMEGGASISMGQRQLVAFARVLIHDPDILILDEATSSLDSISELKLQKALEKVSEGRTVIVIAHRLSTIRNADQILVMDAGEIVEKGTHDELIQKNGLYRQLYERNYQKNG